MAATLLPVGRTPTRDGLARRTVVERLMNHDRLLEYM
jgi:hypothetical protein